ncbi:hypothetical protein GQ53DRAFT_800743 [Thozetella sp. PMI_491]|nr:hypothetical protein GQ53DRAFT_800743 [Thozetella sp. PMI_491]
MEGTDPSITILRLLGLRSPIGLSQSTPQIGRFKSLGIEQLGGLDLEGQLETDLIRASIKLGHPSPFRLVLEDLNARRRPLTSMLLFRVNKHFKEILLDLRLCCKLLDEMYDRISAGCPRKDGMLAYYRDIVQYRLLSLPCGCTEMEIARLASLVFTYGVTHPMVRPEPLRKAVRLLSQSLRMQRYTYGQSAEFLFWAAMVGALGTNPEAEEEALFQYFVDEISASRKRLNLSTWQSAVAVLKGFIWLDRACNEGARIIWTKFCGTKGDNEE